MRRNLIVAMSPSRVIGRGGGLPWRLSADLKRFKSLTMGHPLIMGRKTFDSIGVALPGRTSIVLTRGESSFPAGVLTAASLAAALALAAGATEAFVIGGGQIYQQAAPLVDRLYITWVESELAGDAYFPNLDLSHWRLVEESSHPADAKNEFPHRFCVYDRVSPALPADVQPFPFKRNPAIP